MDDIIINYLRYILLYFEIMSSLKVNFNKSNLFLITLYFNIDLFVDMLGCKEVFSSSLLGLSLGEDS